MIFVSSSVVVVDECVYIFGNLNDQVFVSTCASTRAALIYLEIYMPYTFELKVRPNQCSSVV